MFLHDWPRTESAALLKSPWLITACYVSAVFLMSLFWKKYNKTEEINNNRNNGELFPVSDWVHNTFEPKSRLNISTSLMDTIGRDYYFFFFYHLIHSYSANNFSRSLRVRRVSWSTIQGMEWTKYDSPWPLSGSRNIIANLTTFTVKNSLWRYKVLANESELKNKITLRNGMIPSPRI